MTFRRIVLCFCLLLPTITRAQLYDFHSGWYCGINTGIASYFGDLSVYDLDPVNKIRHESRFVAGIAAGKSLNKWIDIDLSLDHGGLKGSNQNNDLFFKGSFTELTINGHLSLSAILFKNSYQRFQIYISGGAGTIFFRSSKSRISDNAYVSSVGINSTGNKDGSPGIAAVFPAGILLSFDLSKSLIIKSRFAFRTPGNDLIDAHAGSTGINDRYSLATLGIVYIFNPVKPAKSGPLPCSGFSALIRTQ
ncbi:MAG: hypothetical protein M9926_00850 [Lentimicrobium sp.]|uniref:hypothetical protein n=1 Tax=Lentimicrobium sp. TaxID=2034841 RepID=UPI0025CC487D|nr:hypothetical protein [Lentimicrobium sp.]MCO5255280.1 hypothetical protein [Lentimicrobium sp.]